MNGYSMIVGLHVAAGSLALLTFWIAGLMTKGTPRHRRVGQVYLLAMLGVIVSGVPLALSALERGHPVSAAFLGFLLLLVSHGCWTAWRAIRDRRDRHAYFGPVFRLLTALVVLGGSGMIALGLRVDSTLLMVFGGVGLFAGFGAWRGWRRAPHDPKWWLREHYGAMIGNGVATHIAFLGIGLRNAVPGIDPQLQQAVAWFGPLTLALVAGWWLDRRYGGRRPVARGVKAPIVRAPLAD